MGSIGLRTYIWNNRLKSIVLLAGFPFLLLLIAFAFALLISAFDNPDIGEGFENAVALLPALIPVALVAALVWFVIAFFANRAIVAAATGARPLDRRTDPRLWNLLETLCISRGLTMPALYVIDTEQRNAFASGVRDKDYSITVTRGLAEALDDAELEAVLAHELTHIQNRDVQLLVISAVFVGIITLVGDLLVRSPRIVVGGSRGSRWGSVGRGSSSGKKGGGAIVLILVAAAIFILARVLALGLRFALSRKREYLADAGAVELTKNPDAMIGALRKIAGKSELAAPSQIREMFLDHQPAGFFATHPSIDDRIAALVKYGGGRETIAAAEPASPPSLPADTGSEAPGFGRRLAPPGADGTPPAKGPWG
jgi:heat shock protein HtpX